MLTRIADAIGGFFYLHGEQVLAVAAISAVTTMALRAFAWAVKGKT
jgi:hypothetical protein